MISERFKASTHGFRHFGEKFESERNPLFSVIFEFIPRIHAKHSSLDTRVTPEYEHKRSLIKNLECIETAESGVDKVVSSCEKNPNTLLENLDSVRKCAGIFKRRIQKEYTSAKISSRHQLNEFSQNNLRPQCAPDTTGFLSDVYKRGTRARKFLVDGVQCGRSMIEMLGVLAIIGVLSVGGIQGFSKAMETYQSHKQLEQINSLIYHILELRDTFKQDYRNQSTTRINGLMGAINALGYLPDDMKLISNETAQDRFGNTFTLSYGVDKCRQPDGTLAPCSSVAFHLQINLKTINNTFSLSSENQCKNIIKAVTAFDAENGNINRFELRNQADINDSHYTIDGLIYGRQYCSNSRQNCFKNMTPIKMTQFCKSCTTENSCDLVLYLVS